MTPKNCLALTMAFIILAALLQIGGVVSPMWVWLRTDVFYVGVGLFYRVGCEYKSGNLCPSAPAEMPFNYTDVDTRELTYWPHLAWIQTLAAVLSLVLLLMMVAYIAGLGKGWLNTAMILTALFCWLCIVVGLVLFVIYHSHVISRSPEVSSRSFPWSAIMCFLAALLYATIAILLRCRCRRRFHRQHYHGGVATSADAKMALHGNTKMHNGHHFHGHHRTSQHGHRSNGIHGHGIHSTGIHSTGIHSNGINSNGIHYTDQSRLITSEGHLNSSHGHTGIHNKGYLNEGETSPMSHRSSPGRHEVSTPLVRHGSFNQHSQHNQTNQHNIHNIHNHLTTSTNTTRVLTDGGEFGRRSVREGGENGRQSFREGSEFNRRVTEGGEFGRQSHKEGGEFGRRITTEGVEFGRHSFKEGGNIGNRVMQSGANGRQSFREGGDYSRRGLTESGEFGQRRGGSSRELTRSYSHEGHGHLQQQGLLQQGLQQQGQLQLQGRDAHVHSPLSRSHSHQSPLVQNDVLSALRLHSSQVILGRHNVEHGLSEAGDLTDDADTVYYSGEVKGRPEIKDQLFVETGTRTKKDSIDVKGHQNGTTKRGAFTDVHYNSNYMYRPYSEHMTTECPFVHKL